VIDSLPKNEATLKTLGYEGTIFRGGFQNALRALPSAPQPADLQVCSLGSCGSFFLDSRVDLQ
jgi:hypothetical protein